MRRTISSIVLGALLLLVMPAARSEAWVRGGGGVHRHRGGGPHVVVVPFFGWGFYAPPAVVVVPGAPANGLWYYCPSAHAYYPQVSVCQEPWVPVPATPQY